MFDAFSVYMCYSVVLCVVVVWRVVVKKYLVGMFLQIDVVVLWCWELINDGRNVWYVYCSVTVRWVG